MGGTGGEEKKAKTDQSTKEENLQNWQLEEDLHNASSIIST